jgi:hypothetical protein
MRTYTNYRSLYWVTGKGLGRNESGITKAIKPKLKFDTQGVGHDASEQFTYHWWENAFNKAANNIKVSTTEVSAKLWARCHLEYKLRNLMLYKCQTIQNYLLHYYLSLMHLDMTTVSELYCGNLVIM